MHPSSALRAAAPTPSTRMRTGLHKFLALGLLPAFVFSAQAFAQQDSEQPVDTTTPFVDVVDVEIVNIDVWVTGKDGYPLEGLAKDDFVVSRDGRPVEITNFYAVSGGRPVESAPQETDGDTPSPPPASSPMAKLEVAPEHRLWLIVFVDNFNIDPIERNRVLPALEQFLRRNLGIGDQAMLVTYDRALEVRQPFTDDVRLLTETLRSFQDESGLATIRQREQFSTLKLIDDADDAFQALGYARQYAEEQMDAVERTVGALERLIGSLAGLPGRKALIHVSSGVPLLAGEEMFHAVAEKFNRTETFSEIPRYDASRDFERLGRRANATRVAFHTLDAGGLRGFRFGAAEYGGFVNGRLRSTLDSVVPENLQSSLRLMAIETGGRTILNRNEILPALTEVARDFRSFYSLGISSTGADSGRYHKIEVKLRDRPKGATVRHRAGYRSKDMRTRMRESLRAALSYSHQDNPLDIRLRWGRLERHDERNRYVLPLQVNVPLREVAILPVQTGRHEARLELYVGAVGPDGKTSDIDQAPLGIRLADEHVDAAREESLLHTHKLLLAGGRQKIAVAILDVFGGQSSIVTGFVDVGQ